jgi:hypothetical protein
MLNQYGSVLCVSCESSMRLSTVEPGEDGICRVTFECRYPPCARSRVIVIGKLQLQEDVLSVVPWPVSTPMNGSDRRDGGWGFHCLDGGATKH